MQGSIVAAAVDVLQVYIGSDVKECLHGVCVVALHAGSAINSAL
jgi:hypothetical protein